MAKLRLVVEMEVPGDPEPGPRSRMGRGLAHIKAEVERGNTAGEFEKVFTYSTCGESQTDRATYTWEVQRTDG